MEISLLWMFTARKNKVLNGGVNRLAPLLIEYSLKTICLMGETHDVQRETAGSPQGSPARQA